MGVTGIAGCVGLSVGKCRVSKRLAASIPGTTASREPMSETISHLPPCRACPDAAHIGVRGGQKKPMRDVRIGWRDVPTLTSMLPIEIDAAPHSRDDAHCRPRHIGRLSDRDAVAGLTLISGCAAVVLYRVHALLILCGSMGNRGICCERGTLGFQQHTASCSGR